jgi:hypothetical protein
LEPEQSTVFAIESCNKLERIDGELLQIERHWRQTSTILMECLRLMSVPEHTGEPRKGIDESSNRTFDITRGEGFVNTEVNGKDYMSGKLDECCLDPFH